MKVFLIWFTISFVVITLLTMKNKAASDGISSYGFPYTFYSYTSGKIDNDNFSSVVHFRPLHFLIDLSLGGVIGACAVYLQKSKLTKAVQSENNHK
jgi:hypothetical protein